MTTVLSGPEILTLLATSLVLGGAAGVVTGAVINKMRSQHKQPLMLGLLLGIAGYWAGAYISAAVAQVITSNGAVARIYLLAALVGSVALTVIGSIGIGSLRRGLYQQAGSDR